ncbi:MAG: GAF domain-containing protein [Anaerolineales bacterium]|nr:GAF domain-containing protein [Anaerolineales bacterium]
MKRFFITQSGVLRFRIRIAITFLMVGLLVAGGVAASLYLNSRAQLINQIQKRALLAAKQAALQQNGDLHSILVNPNDQDGVVYNTIKNRNAAILATDPDINAIYTMRRDENGNIYFVVEVVREDLVDIRGPARLGEFDTSPGPVLASEIGTIQEAVVEQDFYKDSRAGDSLSAYSPFYRSDGTLEGIVGVDISSDAISTTQAKIRQIALLAFLVVSVVMIALGLILGEATMRPLEAMTRNAEKIITGDFSQKAQSAVGDEIGELANSFNKMSEQLQSLISGLEARVDERTRELTLRSQELESIIVQEERRASQLQAIAQVSAIINTVQKMDELLPRVTRVVSDQFDYYHVGIFLLSDDGRSAVLGAANSEGGQKMLARNHRLRVGGAGIVGYTTATGLARVALDVGDDAYFFDNPDLPNTRSEMAVPLRLGKKIIGALDVQSEKAGAFSQADAELLSVLADQISVAIENARRFEETQKSLSEAQDVYRQYLKTQWREFASTENRIGYKYRLTKTETLTTPQETPEILAAQQSGNVQITRDETARMAVPIKLRGEVIGMLGLQSQNDREWTEDEMDIIRAVAERVAIAAENARLVTETQRKAAKEETIGQISAKISASVNMRNILQTTAEELGRALPGSEVVIQLRAQDNQTQ